MKFIGPKTKIDTLREEYPVSGEVQGVESGPGNWALQDDYETYLIYKDWLDRVGKGKCRHIGQTKRIETDSQGDPLYVYCDQCAGEWNRGIRTNGGEL